MSNEFKYGWYLNSSKTQEKLFELGYKWGYGGERVVKHLTSKYIITYENGRLAYSVFDYEVRGIPKGTQLDREDNIVSNEFKRGWYLNSKETQERLFELGYRWNWSGREARHLRAKYIFTNESGKLTNSNDFWRETPKGTQLDNTPHKHCKLIKAWADGAKIQGWDPVNEVWVDMEYICWSSMKKYRIKPEESEEYTKLKSVISELEDNLNKAKKKLEEL